MPRITSEKKLDAVKAFLKENGIPYTENHKSRWCGLTMPLAIRKYRVAVCVGDSQEFFDGVRGKYYPVFIREADTEAKVVEKVQNTIIKSMTYHQIAINKRMEKANGKLKDYQKE